MKRSTILTIIGAIGVVGTAIATAKAAPKAVQLMNEAEKEKGEDLTVIEKVKVAGPVYIPSIIIGASTIGCILGANILNKRSQAALTSAYALLDNSYKEYRRKITELYGEDADSNVVEAVAKEYYEDHDEPVSDDKVLFFDFVSCRYFEARMEDVIQKITMDDGLECYVLSSPFDAPTSYYIY